jgi:hypothetical protein
MRKATLRMHLKEVLIAYELDAVIDVVNDTYTSLRWLELAESDPGSGPYGDSTFAYDEFLQVQRVEIGTPNFIELYGLADTLTQTLTYLSAVVSIAGISKSFNLTADTLGKAAKARTDWLDGRLKRIELAQREDPEVQQIMKRKLLADTEKAELEATKLRNELKRAEVHKPEPILWKARRLNRRGKASTAVVEYKSKRQEAVAEKLPMIDNVVVDWELIPED